jgi:ABC-type amino acid transport substrate-binding protein
LATRHDGRGSERPPTAGQHEAPGSLAVGHTVHSETTKPMLLAKVNEIIATAKTDGTLNAIAQKWLAADLPADL